MEACTYHTFIPLERIGVHHGVEPVIRYDPQKASSDDIVVEEVGAEGVETIRVRLPKRRNREIFGSAELMMGANHIRVRCFDGVTRMGRIKGKIKKRVWIREGDTLIVIPWSFQDEKCDIFYRYTKPQVDWLRKNRYL
jgi:translation initiation factor 1A